MTTFSNLAEVSQLDAPELQELLRQGAKLRLPQFDNFADVDGEPYRYVMDNILPTLQWVVWNRNALEEEWLAICRMNDLVHDEGRKYVGRSNAYLPTYERSSQSMQVALKGGLFPSDEYIDVWDRDRGQTMEAALVKTLMQYEFDSSARLRDYIRPAIGQYVDLGNGVLKYRYRKDLVSRGSSRMKKGDISTLEYGYGPQRFEGLTVSAPSMFNVYAYPETAESLRDLMFVAERLRVPKAYVEQMKEKERWTNVETALGSGLVDYINGWTSEQSALREKAKISNIQQSFDNPATKQFVAWEIWATMPMPEKAYAPGEDPSCPLSVRIVLIGATPVFIGRNAFFHQMPPYLFARQGVRAGVFYGSGAGRRGRGLQYLANDFFNQTNDVGNFTLNPLVLYNPTFVSSVPPFRPGATIKMRDVNQGMKFERPPVDLIQYGQQLAAQVIQMQQDGTGAPANFQGTGRGAKTATGQQIMQANASAPLQDQVQDLEVQWMVPLLENAWALNMQYRTKEFTARVLGEAIQFLPAELDISPEFKMLSSSQIANKQVRNQQALQFLQLGAQLAPLLMQQGQTFDPVPVLQRIYNDGLGFRGFENVIKPAQAPGMAAMMGAQGAAGEGGVETPEMGGDRMRSAAEQAPEGGIEAQPGEAAEFMDVRQNADALAAMQGGIPDMGGEE